MKYFYLLALLLFAIAQNIHAQTINTIAGGYKGAGKTATSLGIKPQSVAVDAAGNFFIADPEHHIVRKLNASGVYSTVAGNGIYGYSGDGGLAISAQLMYPCSIALDMAGNVFITDSHDHRIRRVDVNGVITTIAGTGVYGFSGDGSAAINAQLAGANAIAADAAGNIFIADFGNKRVRKIATNGIITTVAGNGTYGVEGDGGPATAASFSNPLGVAVDNIGNLYITEVANRIRKVTTNGIVETLAGDKYGQSGFSGDGGPATAASFDMIYSSVAVDQAGNIYIADSRNNRVRKVDINGIVTTIAGNGGNGFSGDGSPATTAELFFPTNVCINTAGEVFISSNNRIRKVANNGIIQTVAGNGDNGYSGDNVLGTSAQIYRPLGLTADINNDVFFTDGDNRIRKIDANGFITTIAGTGVAGFSGDGGPAANALISNPYGITIDKAGNIFFADNNNSRIRKISTNQVITTVAGNGTRGFSGDDGPAIAAQFDFIHGLAIDESGNLFVADRNNHRIRKITPDGIIRTVAGNGIAGFSGDGGNAVSAQLYNPVNIAVDVFGNLFITDLSNYRVRKVTPDGVIGTYAGNGSDIYSGDGGNAIAAGVNPFSIKTDVIGNVYISDSNSIRKISTDGIITTWAGGGSSYNDGGPAGAASLPNAVDIALDASGNFYMSDVLSHRIRKISGSILPLKLTQFRASQKQNGVICSWQTEHEVNTAYFSVQRSMDGFNFVTVASVQAAGNKSERSNYSYTDANVEQLNATSLYYRLQMTDKDGEMTYSNVQEVKYASQAVTFSVMPNPAHDVLYIKGNNIQKITIADYTGKVLLQQVADSHQTVIQLSTLGKGMYVIMVYGANGVMSAEKIVVQ
jgi:sugar lactone lactonase YvrE